jgi:ABC-2 type transport system permease protein
VPWPARSLAAAAPDVLSTIGLSQLDAIRAMFVLYALLGIAGALIYSRIPARPPLAEGQKPAALGPSRRIVYRLAALFSLVVLWRWAGGHVGGIELVNLMLGHFLYGAVIAGIALLAAAFAESNATAAILALAITLGFWVLDFAAVGEAGLLKTLSGLSLTTLLRDFERGIFSLGAALGAAAAAVGLIILSGVWVNLKIGPARKFALTLLVLLAAAGGLVGASQLRFYADATENRRNSFEAADAATLRRLDKRLEITVRLAPEDPRYVDFERNILSKLQRALANVDIRLASQGRSGLFEGSSETYGTARYRYGGREDESRSTGAGEVLPLIYALAGVQRETVRATSAYPGYPLQADASLAEMWFYGFLPLLILTLWVVARGFIPVGRLTGGKAAARNRNFEHWQEPEGER